MRSSFEEILNKYRKERERVERQEQQMEFIRRRLKELAERERAERVRKAEEAWDRCDRAKRASYINREFLRPSQGSSISKDQITQIYRHLATKWHPDRGGSNDAMSALNDFNTAILELIK